MFGFLGAPCRTCHQADHDVYRTYFCGLSTCLASHYGQAFRVLTNRDATFLSLLGDAQQTHGSSPVLSTCCNPWATPRPLSSQGPHVHFAAAINVCALTEKLEDDSLDERGWKRAASRSLHTLMASSRSKAEGVLESLGFSPQVFPQLTYEQEQIERQSGVHWADAAEPTARTTGTILAHTSTLAEGRFSPEALYASGHALGKTIYLLDALKDRNADLRAGRFNPLTRLASPGELHSLYADLAGAAQTASDLLKPLHFPHHSNLLQLILDRPIQTAQSWMNMSETPPEPSSRKRSKKRNRTTKSDRGSWCDSCCFSCDDCCCSCRGASPGGGGGGGCCSHCDGDCCCCCPSP